MPDSKPMNAMLALCALLATTSHAADKTVADLKNEAGAVWDAAHERTRPKRSSKEEDSLKSLFGGIDALTKADGFEPAAVARALGLSADFKRTAKNEHFATFEATLAKGSIRHVEVRVSTHGKSGLAIVKTDEKLGITPGEVADRFGDRRQVLSPSIHAPKDSPYCYLYARPGGELRLCFRPAGAHALESFVWDSTPL